MVLVFPGTVGPALDGDFVVVYGETLVLIVDGDDGLGHAQTGALCTPREDHVFRAFAAQCGIALLAQHPLNGIGDVALSTAVRPYDSSDVRVEDELRVGSERFVPFYFQAFEAH